MIITLVLNIIYLAVLVAFSPLLALPVAFISPDFATAITTGSSYLAALNIVLPVDTLITILSYSVSFEIGYFSFKGIMWIVKRLPTQS